MDPKQQDPSYNDTKIQARFIEGSELLGYYEYYGPMFGCFYKLEVLLVGVLITTKRLRKQRAVSEALKACSS